MNWTSGGQTYSDTVWIVWVATHASLLKDVQADAEKIGALNEFGTPV